MPDAIQPVMHDPGASAARRAATRDASLGFEAMILRPLLDASLPRGESVFGGGTGGETWRSMLVDALARQWAERGSLGMSERLLRGDGMTGIGRAQS